MNRRKPPSCLHILQSCNPARRKKNDSKDTGQSGPKTDRPHPPSTRTPHDPSHYMVGIVATSKANSLNAKHPAMHHGH